MRRVTLWLAVIAICLCMVSGARAAVVPVRILIGTSEAPLAPSPIFDGAGVLAPLQILPMLGASYVDAGDGNLLVTAAGGQMGSIQTVTVDEGQMVPMDQVVSLIGGERIWNRDKRTLTLMAHLDSVEFVDDVLKINCSLPVRASAKIWDGKIIVDVPNAKLASEAKEVYIGAPTVSKARLGQYDDKTARVVLELNRTTGCELQTVGSASQILLKVADGLVPAPAPAQSASQLKAQPFAISSVAVQTVDADAFDIAISTSGKATVSGALNVSPPRIVFDLPGGQISDSCAVTGAHPAVQTELSRTSAGARLSLDLTRPMVYSVEVRDAQTVVSVRLPDRAGGTLAGKLIVIDPGHGGKDPGAQAAGCREKDINLRIAKQLADALEAKGARAVLTRNGDEALGIAARPSLAISQGADLFISIHCNSNPKPNSVSGIETYYHMQQPSPKLLANAIHDGMCKFTGMCDRGVRSDRSLYESGLGVLRGLANSGIPGVLLECGYLNNASDRAKLLDAGYRAKLVSGIIAGLRAYVEGTSIQ